MAFLAAKLAESSVECAVCIPDGARLVLTGLSPMLQSTGGLSATENVTFRQLSAEEAAHRDAVEFRNGLRVRLQDLEEGQRMEVISIGSEEDAARKDMLNSLIVV